MPGFCLSRSQSFSPWHWVMGLTCAVKGNEQPEIGRTRTSWFSWKWKTFRSADWNEYIVQLCDRVQSSLRMSSQRSILNITFPHGRVGAQVSYRIYFTLPRPLYRSPEGCTGSSAIFQSWSLATSSLERYPDFRKEELPFSSMDTLRVKGKQAVFSWTDCGCHG